MSQLPAVLEEDNCAGSGWKASVLTLFPDAFPGSLGLSLAGRARAQNLWSLEATNIRKFSEDAHHSVDGTPAGGGPGMVLRADVLGRAIDHVRPRGDSRRLIFTSARGRPFDQKMARSLSAESGVVLVCGRFEGIDQRVIDARGGEEVSVGDFILSGGEIAAMAILDAVVRLLPGVMGDKTSGAEESFEDGLLEYPHFTLPREWEGHWIPDVLMSGNHGKVSDWRSQRAEEITRARRPDMWRCKSDKN
jgi:tRNA (guanine37-N1)-methyltransferase